jgi:hypothetical protein
VSPSWSIDDLGDLEGVHKLRIDRHLATENPVPLGEPAALVA